MRLLKRQGLILFTCLFIVLLLIHTAFGLYHGSLVNEYTEVVDGSLQDTSDSEVTSLVSTLNQTPGNNTVSSEKVRAIKNSLTTMTILQFVLILSGLPLTFFMVMNMTRKNKKFAALTREIEENNKTYVFNSLDNVDCDNEEEIKSRLLTNLKKAREFIKAISSGNYGIEWEGMNEQNKEANRDSIAGELIHMREQMEAVKQQDQIRIWTTEGLSKFGEIIRNNQDNFDKLSESLISNVVNYLGAKVGGLFILEEDEKDNKKYLSLRACYAYDRKKFITKRTEIGEGMIGQCYLEGHTIHLAKVPDNYLTITSGLGGANPNSLLVIPLRTNDKIEGVLELASLKPFKPHEIEFLEKLGELLASSIINVKSGEKTTQLLAVSREQAEEMRAQEEEMRQNMEELEATQEQMNRTVEELGTIRSTLEKEKYLLDSLMDNIPDAIYFKDQQSKFIRLSKYLADIFHRKVDELIGKSDFDFQDHAHAQEAFDDEKNIMATQKPKIDYVEKEVLTDGSEHWVSTTKMPLINARGEVVGTFGISRDVTKLKKLEIAVLNKDKSFIEEKKQYEEKIKSLEERIKIYEERGGE